MMKLDVHFMSDLVQSEKHKDETTLDQNLEIVNDLKNTSNQQAEDILKQPEIVAEEV